MQIYKELRVNSRREHWREGSIWLLWSLIGGLFPVWLTIICFSLTSQKITASPFMDGGEFALYSASYVAAALCVLFRDFSELKKPSFPSRAVLGLIFFPLGIVSAASFMVVSLIKVIGAAGKPEILTLLAIDRLRFVTLAVYIISLTLSFLVVVVQNIQVMPDVVGMAEDELKTLNEDLDKLNGGT